MTDKQERLVLDMHLYPYPRQEFGLLDMIGPKKKMKRLASIPEVMFLAEADIFETSPVIAGSIDFDVPVVITDGQIDQSALTSDSRPWFLGGSPPTSQVVSWFGGPTFQGKRGEVAEIANPGGGIIPMRFGYTDGEFSVLSESRAALEPLVGKLEMIDADRPAELRVHLGDIANSKIRRFLNAGIWTGANQLSKGNVDLLNRLVTQFHVPADKALSAVEETLRAIPVCPVGGQYIANQTNYVTRSQTKTVSNYESPFLKRLRGAEFELTTEGTTLISHVEVILELP